MALQPYTRTIYHPEGPESVGIRRIIPSTPTRSGGGAIRGGIGAAATKAFAEAEAYYEPGGGFGKGVEVGLERERAQAMSSGMQALVASGFAGTTMAGGLGKKFAEEVGMPTRARLEETRAERLSAIKMLRAQMAQASTEAERSRISQELMARMSAETSLALGGMRGGGGGAQGPTIQYTPQPERRTPFTPPVTTFRDTGSAYGGLGAKAVTAMAPFGGEIYGTPEAFKLGLPEPPTGSVPMGRRYGPTIEEPTLAETAQRFGGLDDQMSTFFWKSIGR